MTTKKEILKMSKDELHSYKWNGDLDLNKENSNCFNCSDCSICSNCSDCSNCSICSDCSNCSICSNCSDCFYCSNCSNCFYCSYCSNCSICSNCSYCSDCSYCSYCRNLKDGNKHQYKICNVQLTKKEYEKKMKEIAGEKEKSK